MEHLLSIDDVSESMLRKLVEAANHYRFFSDWDHPLQGKILCNLFYEPSSRTSGSFYSAMTRLGGNVLPINEVHYSSVSKGESLEDTIRTFAYYSDIIVLRHPEEGAAKRAAAVSSVPIINAGDGKGEHPTQTLTDIYTIIIQQADIIHDFYQLSRMTYAFAGDLKNGRTVHSLIKFLNRYNPKMIMISPPEYSLPKPLKRFLVKQPIEVDNILSLHTKEIDVLYMTRVQRERGSNFDYCLRVDHLDFLKHNCIIMHPLPRNEELPPIIDSDPRAVYFRQMENGLYIRMALLTYMLRGQV